MTNNLLRRVLEHKEGNMPGFTKKYKVNKLIYYEVFDFIELAIAREKQIKGYSRQKKHILIESRNPQWADLYARDRIIDIYHRAE